MDGQDGVAVEPPPPPVAPGDEVPDIGLITGPTALHYVATMLEHLIDVYEALKQGPDADKMSNARRPSWSEAPVEASMVAAAIGVGAGAGAGAHIEGGDKRGLGIEVDPSAENRDDAVEFVDEPAAKQPRRDRSGSAGQQNPETHVVAEGADVGTREGEGAPDGDGDAHMNTESDAVPQNGGAGGGDAAEPRAEPPGTPATPERSTLEARMALYQRFWLKEVPGLSVREYCLRFHKYCRSSVATYLAAGRYVFIMCTQQQKLPLTRLNVYRMFAAAYLVAVKVVEDLLYPFKRYATTAGLSTTELTRLETSFLFLVDFEIKIDHERLQDSVRSWAQCAALGPQLDDSETDHSVDTPHLPGLASPPLH